MKKDKSEHKERISFFDIVKYCLIKRIFSGGGNPKGSK